MSDTLSSRPLATQERKLAPGLRLLLAVATCHRWSTQTEIERMAGVSNKGVYHAIVAGNVIRLPSGAHHLTARGRWLVRIGGVEIVKCPLCGDTYERDHFGARMMAGYCSERCKRAAANARASRKRQSIGVSQSMW